MDRTSKTVSHNHGKSVHTCLVPDLSGNSFTFSPLSMMLVVVCNIWPLCWCSFPLLEIFYHTWVLNIVKSMFGIYWDDYVVFTLQFVNVIYHTDWFADIEKSLYPWDKSHLIIVCDPSQVLLDSVCQYSVEDFGISVHQWYRPMILLFVIFLPGFDFGVTLGSWNAFRSILSSKIFLE